MNANIARDIAVALVTNARNPYLLRHIVQAWLDLGAEVVVCGITESLRDFAPERLILLEAGTLAQDVADNFQTAIDAASRGIVLVTADDILPAGPTWLGDIHIDDDEIRAMRLLSVTGQRRGDWCTYDGVSLRNQPDAVEQRGTFISGGAMLLGCGLRGKMSLRGRGWHAGEEILYCWEARRRGIALTAPKPGGPVLIHLDRLPACPADPERIGVDLLSGNSAGHGGLQEIELDGVRLSVRPGTWDANIAHEVIAADFYLLRLWQPTRQPRFILDIGAHIGSFSAWAARLYPLAQVVACEANPHNAMLAHLNTWELANVDIQHMAVTSRSGIVSVTTEPGPNTGGHWVDAGSSPGPVRAPATTLPALVVAKDIDVIDFLKLDCEGSEWEIVPQIGREHGVQVQCLAMELHLDLARGRTLAAMEAMLRSRFETVHVRTTGSAMLWRVHAMNG